MTNVPPGEPHDPEEHGTELVGHRRAHVKLCGICGESNAPAAVFCEHCGHDLSSAPAARRRWNVEVTVDRTLFLRVAADRDDFPADRPSRSIRLQAGETTIGRAERTDTDPPGISLTGGLFDPAVSHRHARLCCDGEQLTITDLGSTNGTSVNGGTELVPGVVVNLSDGDRINVGAWTALVLRADRDPAS